MADDTDTSRADDAISMDRHNEILASVIMGLAPEGDDTPAEAALRATLTKEVAAMAAKGQIPSIPFD